jgi:chromosomal replication initiation ATPase DnaA
LTRRLTPNVASAWFDAVTLEAISEREIVVCAPTKFHQTYIESHFARPLLEACKACHPSIEAVRVVALCARAAE